MKFTINPRLLVRTITGNPGNYVEITATSQGVSFVGTHDDDMRRITIPTRSLRQSGDIRPGSVRLWCADLAKIARRANATKRLVSLTRSPHEPNTVSVTVGAGPAATTYSLMAEDVKDEPPIQEEVGHFTIGAEVLQRAFRLALAAKNTQEHLQGVWLAGQIGRDDSAGSRNTRGEVDIFSFDGLWLYYTWLPIAAPGLGIMLPTLAAKQWLKFVTAAGKSGDCLIRYSDKTITLVVTDAKGIAVEMRKCFAQGVTIPPIRKVVPSGPAPTTASVEAGELRAAIEDMAVVNAELVLVDLMVRTGPFAPETGQDAPVSGGDIFAVSCQFGFAPLGHGFHQTLSGPGRYRHKQCQT